MHARKRLSTTCQRCRDWRVFIQVKFTKNGNIHIWQIPRLWETNLYVFCESNALVKSEDRDVTVHRPSAEVLVSNNCFHLFHLTFFHPELFNFFHSELNAFMSVFCSVLSPSTRSMFLHHFRFCIANFESILTLMTTLSEPLLKLWSPKLAVSRLK